MKMQCWIVCVITCIFRHVEILVFILIFLASSTTQNTKSKNNATTRSHLRFIILSRRYIFFDFTQSAYKILPNCQSNSIFYKFIAKNRSNKLCYLFQCQSKHFFSTRMPYKQVTSSIIFAEVPFHIYTHSILPEAKPADEKKQSQNLEKIICHKKVIFYR